MKGIILCAGKGTRMQPFTFSSPKTLLPVANEAILDHCLRSLKQAGIHDIGVVLNPEQTSIVDHLLGKHPQTSFTFIRQTEPLGIAHALSAAEFFIRDDPFVLLLGDILITEPLTVLLEAFKEKQGAVMLSKVDHPQDYGVAVVNGNRIIQLEEKPAEPKSELAVAGAYVFDKKIFKAIEKISISHKGEYEITSAIQWMIGNGDSIGYALTKERFFDVGTPDRLLEANRFILRYSQGTENEIDPLAVMENCTVIPPVKIGTDCILKNVVIGPFVSVCMGSTLSDCSIENSICMEGTIIRSPGIPVTCSIFGRYSRLEGRSDVNRMICVLGDKSTAMVVE
ncbi:hypothetical protein SD71_04580 [Cohnella kolymensis]|uniref:Nucleotidyl transferase domain-containing protein n=1 Tax=Cohnella kolymensis TaxID=1590652 RepID=A0ABR5A7J2_9BACL|nr:sugar phosphate nucleotidyltransferase [Cohnella kolymensis]KIL36977.1 hypothetical protein SD71_04580 [Cohnella kolymensis]